MITYKNETTRRFVEVVDIIRSPKCNLSAPKNLAERVPSLNPQKIYNMRNGKNGLTVEILEDFLKAFPTVNAHYILCGEDPMFRDASSIKMEEQSSPMITDVMRRLLDRMDERDIIIEEKEKKIKELEQQIKKL